MKFRQIFAAVFTAGMLFPAVPQAASAPLTVQKSTRSNPTLKFDGIAGDAELSSQVATLLHSIGWFDLTTADQADYRLSGSASGNRATYRLYLDGRPVSASGYTGSDKRLMAKMIVDRILADVFKLKPVCQTRIAFCGEATPGIKNIFLVDIDGRNVRQLTRFTNSCVEPTFFPDGRSLAYTRYGRGFTDVVETSLDPVRSRRLASFPGMNIGVAIDPTRRYMALILSRDKQVELYVKEIESAQMNRLTRDAAVEASPCWSPDGKRICYVSDAGGRPQLYITDISGQYRQKLPTLGREAFTPDWSADNKIVYVTRNEGNYRLAVLDMTNGKNYYIPNLTGNWESPSWAPDNRHIVCSRGQGRSSTLFVVDSWTGKSRELLRTAHYISMPSWAGVPVR